MAEQKYSAPAVKKVLDILELMATQNKPFTVTELATDLDISTNSVFRILKELEQKQYVTKTQQDSSYVLTPKLYFLGSSTKANLSIVQESQQFLSYLQHKTKETVLLAELDSDFKTLVLDQHESSHHIKFLSAVGHSYDSYTSAMGKCLLAYCTDEQIEQYLAVTPLIQMTPTTITDKDLFRRELKKIKELSIAYDYQESIVGLTCIACPVFSATGKLECSIGISGISFRMTPDRIEEYTLYIKEQAQKLSERFMSITVASVSDTNLRLR